MIISEKKPNDEVMANLGSAKCVVLIGCGECATVCKTGGEAEIEATKAFLEENGIKVSGAIVAGTSCNKLLAKKELKEIRSALEEADAVLSLACGDGVQTIAGLTDLPVYPANNTMFLGEVERQGLFSEACRFCGECVLADTGAICPITKCAKSLINGPCGGAKDGNCEVNPDNPCAWILIYEKLKKLGQLDKLLELKEPKGFSKLAYPREINLREAKDE